MSIYYVYAYLRSKDSTIASKGTPYYIGKGSNGRAYSKNHGSISLPPEKSNIVLLETQLSENKAFEIEKFLIAYHGRKDQGTGILLNRTDGGEGTAGHIVSDETRMKMSIAHIGKILSEAHRNKLSTAKGGGKNPMYGKTGEKNPMYGKIGKTHPMYGNHHTNEAISKMSATKKNMPIVICPHCSKQGKGSAMRQWHFNNCKTKLCC